MGRAFASFFCIFLLSITSASAIGTFSASISHFINNPPLLEAYASKSGEVQLTKDISGFYVNIDLADDIAHASDSNFGPDTVPMILGLYTNQSLLVDSCLEFSLYNCSEYSCNPYIGQQIAIDSPYFTGEAYYAEAQIYLDYTYWNLNSNVSIATSCDANSALGYGLARYGVIGMGVAGDSRKNYLASPIFSICLAQDLFSGQLLFGSAISNRIASSTAVVTLQADENWHVNGSDTNIRVGDNSYNLSVGLIFDINADAIGLPMDIYGQIIEDLSKLGNMSCTEHAYQPVCLYKGDVAQLPSIIISLQNQIITINPGMYVQNVGNMTNTTSGAFISLNLKAISPNLRDDSYVTPAYGGYIIIDSHVIKDYYVVFDASSNPTITAYTLNASSDLSLIIKVLIGTVVFLAIMFCCCFCSFKKKVTPEAYRELRAEGFSASIRSHGFTESVISQPKALDEEKINTPLVDLKQNRLPDQEHADNGSFSLNGAGYQ